MRSVARTIPVRIRFGLLFIIPHVRRALRARCIDGIARAGKRARAGSTHVRHVRVSGMKAAGQGRWVVRDKRRLLLAVMANLAGGAHISFEGNLRNLRLRELPGASEEETAALKRNTTWPKQDFVVLAIEGSAADSIMAALGGVVPRSILHIQIEKNGILEFGAYDQFDLEGIFLGATLKGSFVESLISDGVIEHAV